MTDEITALKDEIAGLKTRLQNVEYERDELLNYIFDISTTARCDVLPKYMTAEMLNYIFDISTTVRFDVLPKYMTEEQWASYRLMKIALLASRAQAVVK